MKTIFRSTAIFAALLAIPCTATAQGHDCPHGGPTIEALTHCVHHAYEMGHIDNPGVANSLIAKLNAAAAAVERGNSAAAIRNLTAFIHEVEAQAGKHIDPHHGEHMIHHAEQVIMELED